MDWQPYVHRIGPWVEWFAWYPVRLRKGQLVWLTKVYRHEISFRADMHIFAEWYYGDLLDVMRGDE